MKLREFYYCCLQRTLKRVIAEIVMLRKFTRKELHFNGNRISYLTRLNPDQCLKQ